MPRGPINSDEASRSLEANNPISVFGNDAIAGVKSEEADLNLNIAADRDASHGDGGSVGDGDGDGDVSLRQAASAARSHLMARDWQKRKPLGQTGEDVVRSAGGHVCMSVCLSVGWSVRQVCQGRA